MVTVAVAQVYWRLFATNDANCCRYCSCDSIADKAPFRQSSIPSIDMGKVMPHAGGAEQWLIYRVRPTATNDPARVGHAVNQQEKDFTGLYASKMIYDRAYPGAWSFADA